MPALGHGVWPLGPEGGGGGVNTSPGIVLSGWSQKVEHSGALSGEK